MATVDTGTLATVASIISAFGAAMLFFRIQRELDMKKQGERIWLPVADWLLVAATVVSLLANAFPRIGLVLGRRNAFECVFVRIIIGPHRSILLC